MADRSEAVDIAKNARTLEWLRAELVGSAAQAMRAMARGEEDATLDALASGVLVCYLLARRMGASYARLDNQVLARLEDGIAQGHEIEQWYGDLTQLAAHMRRRRAPRP
ncbi:MAG TPA: MazG-like family protein [Bacillota bacterium]